jgi:mono/diheme cytochrome c family protein/cbb3-type cytochrome oxidase cytochrome c subunit
MKMTFRVIFWGGLAVFFAVVTVAVFTPVAVWRPATTVIAHPYTPAQEYGRQLFYSNGCNYCHTQYVRNVDNAMGPVSEGGNYNFDNPVILGSERTGPDLSYIGRKRAMQWEIDHMRKPREFSPMSIMPDYTFLPDKDASAIAEYLFYLGDRNAAEFMIVSPVAYQDAKLPPSGKALQSTNPSAPPQGWPTFRESGLYEGKLLYVARCMTCHGCAGNGLGTYGGTLIVTPANFKADPIKDMPDDQWFWHVSEGVQGSVMPPWRESLTEKQRWEVISYVQQMYAAPFERDPDEGDVPKEYDKTDPLPVTVDNIDAGKRIWTRECAVCHGDAAAGEGIYRQGIEPVPPSFASLADYADFTDGDYFWRISEGVPWSAMPTWKVLYTEEQRWQLVQYIRTMFTQTLAQPPQPPASERFLADPTMVSMSLPATTSYDGGRQQFLVQCAHCHGLAGDGQGWDGEYLNPKPANLTTALASSVPGIKNHYDGTTLAKVTNGIRNTAMPTWGEFMNLNMRWADVKYLKTSFTEGTGKVGTVSHYGKGDVPLPYVRTDPGIFQDEIAQIDPAAGKPVWEQYCQTCHGANGKGKGPGTKTLASGSPAPLPADMNNAYIFATVRSGIPHTMMYGFQPLLTEEEIWNVTAYVVELTGGTWGG